MGYTYQQIADKCGYPDEIAAYQAVRSRVKNGVRESATELIEVEKNTLEQLQRSAWKMLRKSKTPRDVTTCINSILRIQDRRAKLLGLDAPTKLALLHNEAEKIAREIGSTVEEVMAQAEEIAANAWNKQQAQR